MTKPIFVLSMPRSGSTLLQRLIATHPDVSTASEPWLLLPLVYSTKARGVHAEYRHRLAVDAISDFANTLPGGQDDYWLELAEFARRIYERAAGDTPYFLDKTPRYHLIGHELLRLFPDAHLIVLWRHPLAIVASIIDTWGRGKWNTFDFAIDVESGPSNLVNIAQSYPVTEVPYEELVANPHGVMERVFLRLGLDPSTADLENYQKVTLEGRFGDQVGMTKYSDVSTKGRDWAESFQPALRRWWAVRYVARLGSTVMERMGYELEETIDRLRAERITMSHTWDDAIRMTYGAVHGKVNDAVLNHRAGALRPGRRKS